MQLGHVNHNSILYFSWLYVWQLVVGYQIVTHIPPPELWLAINFKRTFFLVQVNHCSSLTTQEEICSWGKEKKNIWEIFFETQERESFFQCLDIALCMDVMPGASAISLLPYTALSLPFHKNQYVKNGRGGQQTPWGHSWDPDWSHRWNCSTSELSCQ